MRPHPAPIMSGRAACTQVKVPVRLIPMIRSHPSSVMSRTGVNASTPALVTRIPTGPNSARRRSKPAATDWRSATSTSTAKAAAPSPASSSAAAFEPRRSRITRCPSAANLRATPSPIPEAPPVTTAARLTG